MLIYLTLYSINLNNLKIKYMSKICENCNRKAMSGNLRSHSNVSTKRKMQLNLQNKKINNKKMLICTSCLKTINKKQRESTT